PWSSDRAFAWTPERDRSQLQEKAPDDTGASKRGDRVRTGDLVLGKHLRSGHQPIRPHRTRVLGGRTRPCPSALRPVPGTSTSRHRSAKTELTDAHLRGAESCY